ncbi:MAG: DUF4974 domain-containing protein, partial [Candidatus Obscuribacterales bacterium]|nr:DUF4974 domain-containing protein [Candidatus Obscuribacterales bacterium]
MKKGLAMTRLNKGAQAIKLTAAAMAATLFITPMAWAQTSASEPATESVASSGAEKASLKYIPGPNDASRTLGVDPNADAASESAQAVGAGTTAESTGTDAGAADGTAVADTTGGTTTKKLDPAYTTLPITSGSGKIRRQFKLFAKEELIHNLSFRDTPIKEVVAELARRGNLNILLDKSVFGKVTGDLHDVTLNEAMDAVLASAGLQGRILDSNTVIIGAPNALTMLGLNRTHYKVFKLSYS